MLFVAGCSFRTRELKSDKKLVAGQGVAASKNSRRMSVGGRKIEITFGAYIRNRSRLTAPGPSIGNATARNILIMFSAMPPSSKNTGGDVGRKRQKM